MQKLDKFILSAIASGHSLTEKLELYAEKHTIDGEIIQTISITDNDLTYYLQINTGHCKESLTKYTTSKILAKKFQFQALRESVYTDEHHRFVIDTLQIVYFDEIQKAIVEYGKQTFESTFYRFWNNLVKEGESRKGYEHMYKLCLRDFTKEMYDILVMEQDIPF